MQYFQAVQKGKARASISQMKMFDAAGFAMLTLTTKKTDGRFEPVGEEEFAAVIESPDGCVAIITDGDGYTKAQSRGLERGEAMKVYRTLRDSGMPEYPGGEIRIWTESRPTIQND